MENFNKKDTTVIKYNKKGEVIGKAKKTTITSSNKKKDYSGAVSKWIEVLGSTKMISLILAIALAGLFIWRYEQTGKYNSGQLADTTFEQYNQDGTILPNFDNALEWTKRMVETLPFKPLRETLNKWANSLEASRGFSFGFTGATGVILNGIANIFITIFSVAINIASFAVTALETITSLIFFIYNWLNFWGTVPVPQ